MFEFLKMLALSRIYLDNICNIQTSWVTPGLKVCQMGLRFGGNDVGSIMIEENVVSQAGANYHASEEDLRRLIRDAGFVPKPMAVLQGGEEHVLDDVIHVATPPQQPVGEAHHPRLVGGDEFVEGGAAGRRDVVGLSGRVCQCRAFRHQRIQQDWTLRTARTYTAAGTCGKGLVIRQLRRQKISRGR